LHGKGRGLFRFRLVDVMVHVPGTRHTASHSVTVRGKFSCSHCGHKQKARVTAQGTGVAKNVLFLDSEGTERSARTRAENDALNRAEAMLAIVPCPSCGRRDTTAALFFLGSGAAVVVGLILAGFLAGAAFIGSARGVVLGVGAGLVLAAIAGAARTKIWRNASTEVRFSSKRKRSGTKGHQRE
jgi:hypothetical protein